MSTKINLMLPIMQLNISTNNPQIITAAINKQFPGLTVSNVVWIEPNQNDGLEQANQFECVVRLNNIALTLEKVVDTLAMRQSLEQTLSRMKNDIFNMMEKYEGLLVEKNNAVCKLQKLKQVKEDCEDASVSLKIDQKIKKQPQSENIDKQMLKAISELTRQNLRLKDTLCFYQAQFECIVKASEETPNPNNKKQTK